MGWHRTGTTQEANMPARSETAQSPSWSRDVCVQVCAQVRVLTGVCTHRCVLTGVCTHRYVFTGVCAQGCTLRCMITGVCSQVCVLRDVHSDV